MSEFPAPPDTNPKTAVGLTKPSMWAVPGTALLHLGRAMADGARKYGRFNWRAHKVSSSVYYDAIQRHLLAWQDGENLAKDSGVHHLAHVMACCAIILDAEQHRSINDDRAAPGEVPTLIAALTLPPPDAT